jgi:hypothetical protein
MDAFALTSAFGARKNRRSGHDPGALTSAHCSSDCQAGR